MEVDCSLDEFAETLVMNGYINDDSCFTDTDLPTMLCALDAPGVLDSSVGFPGSPCTSEEISRVLEMAQLSGSSLMDSCLPDTSLPQKTSCTNSHAVMSNTVGKTRDPCITHVNLDNPAHNLSMALGTGITTANTELRMDTSIFADTVSLNLNLLTAKESDIINNTYFPVDPNLSPDAESVSSTTSHNSSPLLVPPHPLSALHHQVPGHLASSTESMISTSEQEAKDSSTAVPKQKRKRKSKGYSKPSKSRRKRTKMSPDQPEAPPKPKPKPKPKSKPKKQAIIPQSTPDILNHQSQTCENVATQSASEDSGFESAEKDILPQISSSPDVVSRVSPDNQQPGEETKGLRRSSRSTKKVDSYNLRLSSLVKRVETERRQQEPKQPKGKVKPAPLSKYRRRTANARERDRMKEINDAFEQLKECLPNIELDEPKQKPTKFSILSLALNYITNLREMLGYSNPSQSSAECEDESISSDGSSIRPASVGSSSVGEDSNSCSSPQAANGGHGDHEAHTKVFNIGV